MLVLDSEFDLLPSDARGDPSEICVRVSRCGGLRLHAPRGIPEGRARLRVEARAHCDAELEEDAEPASVVLQGVVVSSGESLLLSHGGMLLACGARTLADPGADSPVRTTLSWRDAAAGEACPAFAA